jgi:hypothetical protein
MGDVAVLDRQNRLAGWGKAKGRRVFDLGLVPVHPELAWLEEFRDEHLELLMRLMDAQGEPDRVRKQHEQALRGVRERWVRALYRAAKSGSPAPSRPGELAAEWETAQVLVAEEAVDPIVAELQAYLVRLAAAFGQHSGAVAGVVDDPDAVVLRWHQPLRDLRAGLEPIPGLPESVLVAEASDYAERRPWASTSVAGEAGALEVLAA